MISTESLFSELLSIMMEKTAYGDLEHTQLTDYATSSSPQMGRGVQNAVLKGNLLVDQSAIREPTLLPINDRLHSFSSVPSREIGQVALGTQDRAVRGIANTIANPNMGASAAAARHWMDIGQGMHGVQDISSHRMKPEILGMNKGLRSVFANTGYGGQIVGAADHVGGIGSPIKMIRGALDPQIDKLSPTALQETMAPNRTTVEGVDRLAATRSSGYMRATMKKLERQLVEQHGMAPEQARLAIAKHMETFSPSRLDTGVAGAFRGATHLKTEAGRGLGVLRGAASRLKRVLVR